MPSFLTVKDAARLTGKSPSSIRRIIYPIIHDDAHKDRGHVEPGVEAVRELRVKGENFAWRLSEELLRREVPTNGVHDTERGTTALKHAASGGDDLLTMLRRELDIKNQQITQQGEQIGKQIELISGLSERLREGNILIGTLQQRLALPDGKASSPPKTVKAKRAPSVASEKGSNMGPKAAAPKRTLWSRLFGSRV